MALWTNAGLSLVANAVQSASIPCAITYAALSPGCGTLSGALTLGSSYSALTLDAGLPATLANGQSLTITDGTNSQTVTTGGASIGATSIPVISFTATHNFAAHTTGICPTPAITDITLYGESVRVAALPGSPGGNAGESLSPTYFDGTQPTGIYVLVGYFGGSGATSSLGSGVLMAEDIQLWNHVLNSDSNTYQADSTV
ncbi:MAG TPA: hypothetical protein VFN11_00785 [Ktedonobacterales bacterium]|nr:hypothetical protein [Ktedonobacterales bacterium]